MAPPINRRRILVGAIGVAAGPLSCGRSEAQGLPSGVQALLDRTLTGFLEKHGVPGGAVAVVYGGRLIAASAYGFADRDAKRAFEPTTLARIGSVSKPITALAILKLVSEGKLRLDEPAAPRIGLEPYLMPGMDVDARLSRTTIRHLLQHCTGYDEKTTGNFTVDWNTVSRVFKVARPTREQIVRYYLGLPRPKAPGVAFAYDNAGYLTLGRIIEKVTGQPYGEYVRREILQPLGITRMNVGVRFRKDLPSWEATPYGDTGVVTETPGDLWESCGGWAASAIDLARIVRALTTRAILKVIPKETVGEILRRPSYVSAQETHYYGLGWAVDLMRNDSGEQLRFSHTGSGGVGCATVQSRWDGCTVCAVFNRDRSGELGALWNDIGVGVLDPVSGRFPTHDLFPKF